MSTALRGEESNRYSRIDTRIHDIGWGLLLVLTGVTWVLPDRRVPEGAWLLGVAGILLGLNVVRYFLHIKADGFSIVLGLLALGAALTQLLQANVPLLAIGLIVIGICLIARPLLNGNGHSGKMFQRS